MSAADDVKPLKAILIITGLLFVVLAIGSLLTPCIGCGSRETARGNTCRNNLRALATALFNYSVRNGHYPGYLNLLQKHDGRSFTDPTLSGSTTSVPVSWAVLILPDIDRQPLYEQWRDVPPQNSTVIRDSTKSAIEAPPFQYFNNVYLEEFLCPSDTHASRSGTPISYVANTGMTDLLAASPGVVEPDGSVNPGTPRDWAANGMFFDHYTSGPRVYMANELVADPKDKTILLTENIDATSYVFRAATHGADNWRAAEVQTGCIWRPGKVDESKKPPTMMPPAASLQPNVGIGEGNGTSYDYCRPSSRHPQLVNVAFVGQNVSTLRDNVSYYVYAKLMASDDENVRIPGMSRVESDAMISRDFRMRNLFDEDLNP